MSEASRRKRRTAGKNAARAIVGVSLELINKKRTEKPEVRQASREAALREVKERAKKAKADKATKAPAASKQGKQQAGAVKAVGRGKR